MTLSKQRICHCSVPPLLQAEYYGIFEPCFCCLSIDSLKSSRGIFFILNPSAVISQLVLLLSLDIKTLT